MDLLGEDILQNITDFPELVAEYTSDDYVKCFMDKANDLNLFNLNESITIFMPKNCIDYEHCDYYTFLCFWNIHTTNSSVFMPDKNAILQIRTNANITYAMYTFEGKKMIGTSLILDCNNLLNEHVTVHYLQDPLMDLRFERSELSLFPLVVLSHQEFEMNVVTGDHYSDVKHQFTLHYSFKNYSDRKTIGSQKMVCDHLITNMTIVVPEVYQKQEVNFWLDLIFNPIRIPVVSWVRPQNMKIFPNINQKENIVIGDFNPSRVYKNQPLWIHGEGFSSTQCRVTIGQYNAIIYSCSSFLIKCIVPDLGDEDKDVIIQVSNCDLFVTAHNKLKFISTSKKRKSSTAVDS
jgi:hypothetical protein